MDKMIYLGMNAAKQQMHAQHIIANNLANVNTTAFKEDLAVAVQRPVAGTGFEGRIFSQLHATGFNSQPGVLLATQRELDVAIHGEGWIAVEDAQGQEAYTRSGALQINTAGFLETQAGQRVLGQGGPILVPPADQIQFAGDGTVSVLPQGADVRGLVEINRLKLVKPEAGVLHKDTDGLFRPADPLLPILPDPEVQLVAGTLETSNVNAVGQLVDMIAVSRGFEISLKLMQHAEENDRHAAQLMQINA